MSNPYPELFEVLNLGEDYSLPQCVGVVESPPPNIKINANGLPLDNKNLLVNSLLTVDVSDTQGKVIINKLSKGDKVLLIPHDDNTYIVACKVVTL